MGWYIGSKLALDKLRYVAMGSKHIARNPFQPPTSGKASQLYDQWKVGTSSALLSSRFGHLGGLRENPKTQLFNVGRRYYHLDRYQVSHFRPRGFKKWYPWNVLIVVLLGPGAVITVYFANLETIPYTKRTHFVLMSRDCEKRLGEYIYKQKKAQYEAKLLPATHPDSVRVRLIAKDLIEALQRGLKHKQVWSDPNYAFEEPKSQQSYGSQNSLKAPDEGKKFATEGDWRKEEEFPDDKWVKESRKKGEARGTQPATQHLDHVNWEVIVVDDPLMKASCLPGGKIVVFTGLFKHFKSDADIATIIGHEIGHAVARHWDEWIFMDMWSVIVLLILYQFVTLIVVNTVSTLLLRMLLSRKTEIEADYIGLLLMASAGYDPRVAPAMYEKLGKIVGSTVLDDYLASHPSGKKRAQLLAQAQVMQEAMTLYRERMSDCGIEGFP